MGAAKQANETSREELLIRDVKILFDENRSFKDKLWAAEGRIIELEKELAFYKKRDEEENGTLEDIAFYILNQKQSLGLSYEKLGHIFGLSGATIQGYVKCKGNIHKARAFADKLREFRKSYGKSK